MIIDWKESWENETISRRAVDTSRICTFGVKPLDDALIGFLPDDLMVIAADSGTGKSQIGLDIAIHNATQGRRVALYSIEGNDSSAMSRIKWKTMNMIYYTQNRRDLNMDYRKWRMNMDKSQEMIDLEAQAMRYMDIRMGDRLFLYHANETFTFEDFKSSLGWFSHAQQDQYGFDQGVKYDIDLLIVDHLQYFTFDNPINELSETTEILKHLKNLAEHHKIPVLLISHLRKKDKNRGIPSQEDLFGTSNTAKIASQVIVLAPCYTNVDYANGVYPTFFRFVKSRTGLKSNYVVVCDFSLKTGTYSDQYTMHFLKNDVPVDQFKSFQLPNWAYKPPDPIAEEVFHE